MDAKLERRKNYCALAVALLEDLPMGASFLPKLVRVHALGFRGMTWFLLVALLALSLAGVLNMVYLVNSIGECVDPKCRWSEQSTYSTVSRNCACDLDARSIIVLLLSSLTSAAMFAFKVSALEVIKLSLDMDLVLEEQHAELISELQAALGPSDFRKVSQVLQEHAPRKISVHSHLRGPASVVPDGSSDGSPNQVRPRRAHASSHRPEPNTCCVLHCRWATCRTRTSPPCIR
jgi:hypothetical protein